MLCKINNATQKDTRVLTNNFDNYRLKIKKYIDYKLIYKYVSIDHVFARIKGL